MLLVLAALRFQDDATFTEEAAFMEQLPGKAKLEGWGSN